MGASRTHKIDSLITLPRSSRSMDLTFGLMRVSVAWAPLFKGDAEGIKGHKYCTEHHSRLSMAMKCEHGDHYVSGEEIEMGYDYGGNTVVLSEGEIKSLEAEKDGTITLTKSCPVDTIDPSYYEKAYLLWPTPHRSNETVFLALLAAMRLTKLALVGEFVVSKTTRLLVIRWSDEHGTLVAHVCNFAANLKETEIENVSAGKQAWNTPPAELVSQAAVLLKTIEADFDPGEVEDSYQASLALALFNKAEGIEAEEVEDAAPVDAAPDLMQMMRASIEAARAGVAA